MQLEAGNPHGVCFLRDLQIPKKKDLHAPPRCNVESQRGNLHANNCVSDPSPQTISPNGGTVSVSQQIPSLFPLKGSSMHEYTTLHKFYT